MVVTAEATPDDDPRANTHRDYQWAGRDIAVMVSAHFHLEGQRESDTDSVSRGSVKKLASRLRRGSSAARLAGIDSPPALTAEQGKQRISDA